VSDISCRRSILSVSDCDHEISFFKYKIIGNVSNFTFVLVLLQVMIGAVHFQYSLSLLFTFLCFDTFVGQHEGHLACKSPTSPVPKSLLLGQKNWLVEQRWKAVLGVVVVNLRKHFDLIFVCPFLSSVIFLSKLDCTFTNINSRAVQS